MDSATIDADARLSALRDDQYRRWQAGDPIPAERYLSEATDLSAEDALILIWGEVRLRAAGHEGDLAAERLEPSGDDLLLAVLPRRSPGRDAQGHAVEALLLLGDSCRRRG